MYGPNHHQKGMQLKITKQKVSEDKMNLHTEKIIRNDKKEKKILVPRLQCNVCSLCGLTIVHFTQKEGSWGSPGNRIAFL